MLAQEQYYKKRMKIRKDRLKERTREEGKQRNAHFYNLFQCDNQYC